MGRLGPTLAANVSTLVTSTLYYLCSHRRRKNQPSPKRVQVVTGKNREIAKKRYKGEEERVKSKENSVDAMFVLL